MQAMVPREHGAYGQLLLPLTTAMAIGRPSLTAVALAVAACAAFVAHEPVLVLLGRRGERMKRQERRRAIRWLVASASIAAVSGALGAVMLSAAVRWTLLVPVALAAVGAQRIVSGRERSASGEIVAASALASVSLPVAVASGATVDAACACASAFGAGFIAATTSVRAIIRRAHGDTDADHGAAVGTIAGTIAGMVVLAVGRVVLPAALWASAPMCVVAYALAVAAPSPRYLRRIGWALVAATALAGVILVIAVR